MIRHINKGDVYVVRPGDHFIMIIADGTIYDVEQTADDFSIVHGGGGSEGIVAYTMPTSETSKENDAHLLQVTGRK